MTRDEAVARIQEGLSFRRGLTEQIQDRMEEARRDLETGRTVPWFLKVEDATLTLLSGTSSIALPTGFIRQDAEERLRYAPLTEAYPRFIPWRSLAAAQMAYSTDVRGGPSVAVLRSNAITVFPVADVDYTLYWSYFAHSEALNEDDIEDHPWLVNCPDAIIGEAGLRMAEDLKDTEAATKFNRIKASGNRQFMAEQIARESGDGPMIMGANN